MTDDSEQRYYQLCEILAGYGRVAVAYSGGVDSSLLAHAALETLGSDNVLILHGVSCLQSQYDLKLVRNDLERDPLLVKAYCQVNLDPLEWADFVENSERRCYFCKRHLYGRLLKESAKAGCAVLVDGTNSDDQNADRPGLLAIKELDIQTPLDAVKLGKKEIRLMAARFRLSAHDRLSNSCLATRIPRSIPISFELLQLVERGEDFLRGQGFRGCRVRPRKKEIVLQVLDQDFVRLSCSRVRHGIVSYFQDVGLGSVAVELKGRPVDLLG